MIDLRLIVQQLVPAWQHQCLCFSALFVIFTTIAHGAVTSQGSLRALQIRSDKIPDETHFDVESCSSDVFLHDNRSDNITLSKEAKESRKFLQQWLKNEFVNDLRVGTLNDKISNPRQMLLTVPDEGFFIFWGQFTHRPSLIQELELSLFSGNAAHEKRVQHGNYVWSVINPDKKHPTKVVEKKEVHILEEGPNEYIIFVLPWFSAYQHLIIDHIGYWSYMRENFPTSKFVFIGDNAGGLQKQLLRSLDPHFLKRIVFWDCSYNGCNDKILHAPPKTKLSLLVPGVSTRNLELLESARCWAWHAPRLQFQLPARQNIIYYRRTIKGNAYKGRLLNFEQEQKIIEMIRHDMKRFKRPEQLVVFDGTVRDFDYQVEIFRTATVVIGPHGGALANLLFAPPVKSCKERTKVLEFVTSSATPDVQMGGYNFTYYNLFSTMPWIELHQAYYLPPSNQNTTYIDMKSFSNALKSVMSNSYVGDQSVSLTSPETR